MKNNSLLLPEYKENFNEAAEYLRLALPLMKKNGMPANPINYSIWYEFVSGTNKKLNEIIENALEENKPFTTEYCKKLYSDYVLGGSPEKYQKLSANLKSLVNQTLTEIEETSQKTSQCTSNFADQSNKLANVNDPNDAKAVIKEVLRETQQLTQISRDLNGKLHQTNKEVESLREELKNMKEMANTDALTGLLNRRALDREINNLFDPARSRPSTICLLLLDLDHFKKINDKHGHIVGDKVLRYTAVLLKQFLKNGEIAARYGGEEMAMLLPYSTREKAMDRANQIREALSKGRLKRKDNGESIGQITISIGISELRDDDTVDSFIHRADLGLYKAKENGRNQVIDGSELANARLG